MHLQLVILGKLCREVGDLHFTNTRFILFVQRTFFPRARNLSLLLMQATHTHTHTHTYTHTKSLLSSPLISQRAEAAAAATAEDESVEAAPEIQKLIANAQAAGYPLSKNTIRKLTALKADLEDLTPGRNFAINLRPPDFEEFFWPPALECKSDDDKDDDDDGRLDPVTNRQRTKSDLIKEKKAREQQREYPALSKSDFVFVEYMTTDRKRTGLAQILEVNGDSEKANSTFKVVWWTAKTLNGTYNRQSDPEKNLIGRKSIHSVLPGFLKPTRNSRGRKVNAASIQFLRDKM